MNLRQGHCCNWHGNRCQGTQRVWHPNAPLIIVISRSRVVRRTRRWLQSKIPSQSQHCRGATPHTMSCTTLCHVVHNPCHVVATCASQVRPRHRCRLVDADPGTERTRRPWAIGVTQSTPSGVLPACHAVRGRSHINEIATVPRPLLGVPGAPLATTTEYGPLGPAPFERCASRPLDWCMKFGCCGKHRSLPQGGFLMGKTESSRAESAAVVLKKALPGAISQLLVLGVVAVIGLTAWGSWYAWDAYQYWNRQVKNQPVGLTTACLRT